MESSEKKEAVTYCIKKCFDNIKKLNYLKASEGLNGAIKVIDTNNIKMSLFDDHFEIQYPNTENKSFYWDSISTSYTEGGINERAGLYSGIDGDVAIIILDKDSKECFYGIEERGYHITPDRRECWNDITSAIVGLIKSVIYYLKNEKLLCYKVDLNGQHPYTYIHGDAVNDSRKIWNKLMNKWNEIFLRESEIECYSYTDSELAKLPKWRIDRKKEYYFKMGEAVIEIEFDGSLWNWKCEKRCELLRYSYYPDPYSKTEEYLYFSYDKNGCSLSLISKDNSINLHSTYECYNNLETFFSFLNDRYKWENIYNNIFSFSLRVWAAYQNMKNAKEAIENEKKNIEHMKQIEKLDDVEHSLDDELGNW